MRRKCRWRSTPLNVPARWPVVNHFRLPLFRCFRRGLFRHGNIFINRQAGINTPKDLEGKRIGIQEYRQSAGIWIRGILRDEYGVDTETIQWIEGGVNEPRKANRQ